MNLLKKSPLNKNKLSLFMALFLMTAFFSKKIFASWEYITSNDVGNDFYISSESIKKSGWNRRIAIELINYSNNARTSYKSGIVKQEYECNSFRVRTLSASAHSEPFGKGKTLVRESTPNMPWQTMPKVSVATQTRDYICSKSL